VGASGSIVPKGSASQFHTPVRPRCALIPLAEMAASKANTLLHRARGDALPWEAQVRLSGWPGGAADPPLLLQAEVVSGTSSGGMWSMLSSAPIERATYVIVSSKPPREHVSGNPGANPRLPCHWHHRASHHWHHHGSYRCVSVHLAQVCRSCRPEWPVCLGPR